MGLLRPILMRGGGQRISLYADDVVLFLQSCLSDFALLNELLRIFGIASGLVTNITKCSVTPIHCGEQEMATVHGVLPCKMTPFPCRYLGLPLSVRKPTKADLLYLIDKIAAYLPGWKASLMHQAGRAALIKSVLTAVPIHHLIVLSCPNGCSRLSTRSSEVSYGKDGGTSGEATVSSVGSEFAFQRSLED